VCTAHSDGRTRPSQRDPAGCTARVILLRDGPSHGLLDSTFGHHNSHPQRRLGWLERESRLEQALAEIAISHLRLDRIVLMHLRLHLEHAGGMMSAAGPTSRNAGVWVQRARS
jgi:hypothetical protein